MFKNFIHNQKSVLELYREHNFRNELYKKIKEQGLEELKNKQLDNFIITLIDSVKLDA
jgi:hypothetical protein